MLFSSLPFLFLFLPLFLISYFIVPKKCRNLTLLLASLIFYSWGEPTYIVLLVFSSIVDYTNGLMIEKNKNNRKRQRVFLILSIFINLGLLAFFKYSGFFIENISTIIGLNSSFNIALPIGISFYTFQTMSYSIDVYRGSVKAEKNFVNFMTYVSMFPQLIAGPIVRYQTISEQLNERNPQMDDFCDGLIRFVIGLGKKVIIANNVGLLFTVAIESSNNSIILTWLAIIGYALQIYFDFSGYSDMAIGIGRILGFTYNENFDYPYIATNITDFWRRWHISLSSFFRDYLYIPLGGNRCSIKRNIFNILIVWALTGLWHGAAWNFILWGFYYGVLLIVEKFFLKKVIESLPKFLMHLYTIFFVLIGWLIFSVESLDALKTNFLNIFGFNGLPLINDYTWYILHNFGIILLIGIIFSIPVSKTIERFRVVYYLGILVIIFLSVMYLVDASFNPFLYFRF